MSLYERFQALDVDKAALGLIQRADWGGYFCTPVGARVIGWEGVDGIHYCFVDGFGETVFAVNPMPMGDQHVYPLARNFQDFLRLLLAAGSATMLEQIVWMSRERFEEALRSEDNQTAAEQREILARIAAAFDLRPMDDPYGYVRAVQAGFDGRSLPFTDEYYDVTGQERPEEGNHDAD